EKRTFGQCGVYEYTLASAGKQPLPAATPPARGAATCPRAVATGCRSPVLLSLSPPKRYGTNVAIGESRFGVSCDSEFVDPGQVDQQQSPRIIGRGIEAIKIYRLLAVVGAHAHEVTLITPHTETPSIDP